MGNGKNARLLMLAFAAIGVTTSAASGAAFYEAKQSQRQVNAIVSAIVTRTELASRIQRDFDTMRLLLDDHILRTDEGPMRSAEARLAALDTDIETASRAYGPLAIANGQTYTAWQQVEADIAAIRPVVAEILRLSRENRDTEAYAVVVQLEPRFRAVDVRMATMIRLDYGHELRATRVSSNVAERAANAVLALGLAALAVTLLVGVWATRLVRDRENESEDFAARLEAQNRELDAFASRVAHDLRNPLTAVKLSAVQLANHTRDDEELKLRLTRGIARMERLIEDLLALSRVSAGVADATCDIAVVASQLEADLRPLAERDGVELEVRIAPALVRGGEALLRQALWNLGENAVKYRRPDEGARVSIRGAVVDGAYELRVADNGIGLAPEEVQQVFAPFYRAPSVARVPGTGLGLSIVKRIAEASGGRASVESTPGVGTTFVLHLGLARGSSSTRG